MECPLYPRIGSACIELLRRRGSCRLPPHGTRTAMSIGNHRVRAGTSNLTVMKIYRIDVTKSTKSRASTIQQDTGSQTTSMPILETKENNIWLGAFPIHEIHPASYNMFRAEKRTELDVCSNGPPLRKAHLISDRTSMSKADRRTLKTAGHVRFGKSRC